MPKDKEEKKKKLLVVEEEVSKKEQEEDKVLSEVSSDPQTSDNDNSEEKTSSDMNSVESEDNSETQAYDERTKSTGLMWIIVLTALLVGALAGGFITYFSGISKVEQPSPSPLSTVTPVPEPSEEPSANKLERTNLTIQVLNGSGVAGAAGKARDFLEGLGYKDVAVGNADSSSFDMTTISIKKDKDEYLKMLVSDLEDKYSLSDDVSELNSSSKYDVIITLGKK